LQALDLWMAEADRLGLHILLDFHSVTNDGQYQTWFLDKPADFHYMYNGLAYSQADWIRDLVFVANRYRALPHFMAIDVNNEPNGVVRWDAGDPLMTTAKYYWRPAVEAAAAAILASNPNLLIFVQGSGGNDFNGTQANVGINWGENFQGEAAQPLNVPANKLVLSPHTYGPDVSVKASFSAPNFPANLAADWEVLFGQFYPAHAVIIGEWGGKYGAGTGGAADKTWQDALVTWLLSKGITDSFYWCYTPNSGDTGGILDDSLAVIPAKMALLHRLWGV
jgi:aryl-phospho-beta-D-glucosidase BglC (GH1 family)